MQNAPVAAPAPSCSASARAFVVFVLFQPDGLLYYVDH